MDAYSKFLETKALSTNTVGLSEPFALNDSLFDWQRDIVSWALRRGRAAIFADCGLGKGQPEGALVLTDEGFIPNTELRVGMKLIASDGKPYPLLAIHKRGRQPLYRVRFSDGAEFTVDADHLHIVRTNNDRRRHRPWRVMSTRELLQQKLRYGKDGKSRNWDIPVVAPIEFGSAYHQIHPYILGVLLGDGGLTQSCVFTSADQELIDTVRRLLPGKWSLSKRTGTYDYAISCGGSNNPAFIQELRRLGLFRRGSKTKFIPKEYLLDSVQNRIELLRGLMDTDGYIASCSQYYTVSDQLADDVMFLVRSLGGIPTRSIKYPTYTHNGELRNGAPCHVITFSLRTFNPFCLRRKAQKWNPDPRDNGRWIDSIERVADGNSICLSVDSPDHSYVTEHFIVTHNTIQQLSWAQEVVSRTGGRALILAPLAVAAQTVQEGAKFGITVKHIRSSEQVEDAGLYVCNYEMLHRLDPAQFNAVVLDESSILKSYDGKMRNQIIDAFGKHDFRLACTATPAPNDFEELGNHSQFLGIMSRAEMLSTFFMHDGGSTSEWRLKGHAEEPFWKWVASWAIAITKPSDLGYEDADFILPPLEVKHHAVKSAPLPGQLFAMEARTLDEQRKERKASLKERVKLCADMVNASDESWLIWCNLNDEGDALEAAIPGAVQVSGSDSNEKKEAAMLDFAAGRLRVMISKPRIAGYGMNFQICHKVAFVGLSHSYEQFYQAVRRCWRFGQKHPVMCHVITSEAEGSVIKNIMRKEEDASRLHEGMVKHMSEYTKEQIGCAERTVESYSTNMVAGSDWTAHLGDCVEVIKTLPAESVHYSIFSPPFASLYTYTNSDRDMGNCKEYEEFAEHFSFLVPELLRITKPGRLLSFHCMNLPLYKFSDGVIGLRDFRGMLIQQFVNAGFVYHSEVTIWKDPVTAMQRTKAIGLLHRQLKKDSCMSRQGIADYLVTMRKPGDNPEPVSHTDESFPVSVWQRYASPVWMDINPNKTLQRDSARDEKDEKHICPLQLEVIERALELWTNPGDVVFSPFMGIGSEGYVALGMGRQFVGIELKESYFRQATANLAAASAGKKQLSLFAALQPEAEAVPAEAEQTA